MRTKLQLKPSPPALAPVTAASTPVIAEKAKTDRPDRAGKKLVAGHFPTSIARRLKVLAASEDRTVQSLLDEALTDLLAKYDRC